MSAKQGGSFATMLLAIPLAVIPLMAIFGIPEFTHVTASEEDADSEILREPARFPEDHSGSSPTTREDYRGRAADLFVPRENNQPADNDSKQESRTNRIRVLSQSDDGERSIGQSNAFAAPFSKQLETDLQQPSPRPMPTSAREPASARALSEQFEGKASVGVAWRDAARRLEEVGINDYRLERGHRSDRFLFVCLFSPGSDPRVIQRFEAEAAEPLAAVEDVLTQVDHWLQHRYAENRRWNR